ncbi:MAG: hypothetical protein CMP68_05285 [Flavobacteriales bacterium]|nr:hypothetical protein [Flavobacteriales bacterium]|tara:strand:+ start:15197 stop:15883 length:687 start_codon:yes stop_codon:yes gene_type:complete
MKLLLYILLIPIISISQNEINKPLFSSKDLKYSTEVGIKYYTGNLFLNQYKYSREGLVFNFNTFYKKSISKNSSLRYTTSIILSNAIAKKITIDENIEEIGNINFTTKIPNILSFDINFSFEIEKKISKVISNSIILKFRLYPLIYKKGNILNTELNSLGGLTSSEDNGSLASLEKASCLNYSINFYLKKKNLIRLLLFVNSDWSLNNINKFNYFPGFEIKFEKIINL